MEETAEKLKIGPSVGWPRSTKRPNGTWLTEIGQKAIYIYMYVCMYGFILAITSERK